MGQVYVFNASSQTIRLMINNSGTPGAGVAAAPLPGHSPTPYTPYSEQIAVTKPPNSNNVFLYGQANSIEVQSQLGNATPAALTFPTAPESPEQDVLWLYVFYTTMALFYPTGALIQMTSFNWP